MSNILITFKNPRVIFAFVYDLLIAGITFWMALILRFDGYSNIPLIRNLDFNRFFFVSILISGFSFIVGGLYKGVWRFSSMHDLIRVVRASVMSVVLSVFACFYMTRLENVPRSMFLIQLLLLVIGLGGGRFVYRFLKDQTSLKVLLGGEDSDVTKVLIVGAGRAGEKLLRDINSTPSLRLKVVGFVDDDRYKRSALIHNVKVFGRSELIPEVCKEYNVEKIFIAIPSASGAEVKRIVKHCDKTGVEIKILPQMGHLLSTQVAISLLQNLKIEDLLGREQIKLDTDNLFSMIEDKVVLVTGAGGSIGSELCLQIAKFQPRLLVMADYCELFMYELELKFKEFYPDTAYFPKILDVRNSIKTRKF